LKSGREGSAGFALGFALLKFQFVLPFVFIFVIRRRWRFVSGFLLSCGLLGLISILGTGFAGMALYARLLLNVAVNPQNQSYGSAVDMPTFHGFLYALLGERLGHSQLTIISAAVSVLLLVWIARKWQVQQLDRSVDLLFAAATSSSLLAGSHMFVHDFSPLIVALFLVAKHLPETSARLRVLTAVSLVIFWAPPIYFLAVAWHCLYLVCPILLLFTCCAMRSVRLSNQHPLKQVELVGA
jgi:hypothetical protein